MKSIFCRAGQLTPLSSSKRMLFTMEGADFSGCCWAVSFASFWTLAAMWAPGCPSWLCDRELRNITPLLSRMVAGHFTLLFRTVHLHTTDEAVVCFTEYEKPRLSYSLTLPRIEDPSTLLYVISSVLSTSVHGRGSSNDDSSSWAAWKFSDSKESRVLNFCCWRWLRMRRGTLLALPVNIFFILDSDQIHVPRDTRVALSVLPPFTAVAEQSILPWSNFFATVDAQVIWHVCRLNIFTNVSSLYTFQISLRILTFSRLFYLYSAE